MDASPCRFLNIALLLRAQIGSYMPAMPKVSVKLPQVSTDRKILYAGAATAVLVAGGTAAVVASRRK
jgi:hypothetical protein